MKPNKGVIAFIIIVIALVIAIGVTIDSNLDNKMKEVKVAKEFISELQQKDIIDTKLNLDEIEFKSMPKLENKNAKVQYTVISENIGIDLDGEYVVIGFSNKNTIESTNNLIEEDKAIKIATEYVNEITNEKFTFKKIKESKEGDEDSNIHIVVFYKYFKNYPYYDSEIVVGINKVTGKLEIYTNQNIKDVKHNIKKDISEKDAEKISEDYFIKLNKKSEILEKPLLAFTLGRDGEFELSYVINVETTDTDNKKDKYEVFINAESGEVVNVLTNSVKTSISN